MEPIILYVTISLCSLLIFLLWKFDEPGKDFARIPGPKGLPLVGNIGDFFCRDEEIWRRMRARALKYYPIYKMKIFNQKVVHLLDPADVEVILSDPTITKGLLYEPVKNWLGSGILVSEGEKWRSSRKRLTKSFHFGALSKYMNTFNNEVEYLTKSIDGEIGKPLDLSHFLEVHTLKIILETLCKEKLDMKERSANLFLKAIETMSTIVSYKMMIPLMNILYKFTHLKQREDKALKIFTDFGSYVIEKNRNLIGHTDEEESELLNILLKNFDDKRILDEINTFLFTGQDTTSTALYFILYILANKPYYQEELLKEIIEIAGNEDVTYGKINEMKLLDRFIKECLRMWSVATFIGRTLHKDVSVPSGYTIPAGTNVFIHIFDIHRNPKLHPKPEIFDPDRFLPENVLKRHPFSYLPFSAGPRNCIAQKFAMLELKLTICGILMKYRMEAIGSLEDIIFVTDLLLKSKSPLRMKLIPRSSN